MVQHLQGAGELVWAAGAAAAAVDAAQARNDFVLFHADAEGGKALGVAVAAAGVLDAADHLTLQLDVDLLRAHDPAGEEGRPADAALLDIGNGNHLKHTAKIAFFAELPMCGKMLIFAKATK